MKNTFIIIGVLLNINAFSQTVNYEVFATVEQSVGNIAFTHKGDLVYSHHPFFNPKFRVVKFAVKNQNIHRKFAVNNSYICRIIDLGQCQNTSTSIKIGQTFRGKTKPSMLYLAK